MTHRTSPARIHKTRALLAASLLTVATVAAMPASVGAAPAVQRCLAPLPDKQSGRQEIAPGINGLATKQTITSKVNLFQCSDAKGTGRSGVLTTSLTSCTLSCTAFTSPHTWNFAGSIKWVNKTTSTLKLAYKTTGASRLANVTGTVTAGVYAGHKVSVQFKWKPIISPHTNKVPDACANTVATGEKGRIKIVGHIVSTTKVFTIT
jgi:hypothetical protein